MDPTTGIPSRLRRILGFLLTLIGAVIVAADAIYFIFHIAALGDIAAILLGTFAATVGLTLFSFGMFLAGRSLTTRRVGCIASLVFGTPAILLFLFLVVSLFQTTRPTSGAVGT